jgi:micrococcal nuclease
MATVRRSSRRYWYDYRAEAFWIVCLLLLSWRAYSVATSESVPELLSEGPHEVRRVIDGDTLLLASGARVRLQGIDAPESVTPERPVEAWGPEASQFAKDFVDRAGGQVRLTFGLERKDRFDRFLAFVWDGDVMLNEELLRAGLAQARLGFRYSGDLKSRFAKAEEEARRAGRGIWSNRRVLPANSVD